MMHQVTAVEKQLVFARRERLIRLGAIGKPVYRPIISNAMIRAAWDYLGDAAFPAKREEGKPPSVKEIKASICYHFQITEVDLIAQRRTREIVRPRQIGMYLAKTYTPFSLGVIGRHFGNRDHTTVLHAVRLISDRRDKDRELRGHINSIEMLLGLR